VNPFDGRKSTHCGPSINGWERLLASLINLGFVPIPHPVVDVNVHRIPKFF